MFGMHAGITAVYGCTHGDVRLASGSTTNRGRVEVCVGQTWGTVCNSGFDSNDGRVVCRQLGYDVDKPGASEYMNKQCYYFCSKVRLYTIVYTGVTTQYYGQGSGHVWLRNVQCKGTEQRLLDCNRGYLIGDTGCNHVSDIGVTCPS